MDQLDSKAVSRSVACNIHRGSAIHVRRVYANVTILANPT